MNLNRDSEKNYFGILALVFIYSCLSILYFKVLDPRFYLRNILDHNIAFAVPVPYVLLVAVFIILYSHLSKEKMRLVAYPIIVMAMLLPLSYLLTDLRIGMCDIKPFSWGRGLYTVYVEIFYLIYMLIFSIYTGSALKRALKDKDRLAHNTVLQMPVFIWFVAIEAMLLTHGFILYSLLFSIAVFAPLSVSKTDVLPGRLGPSLKYFDKELLLLAGIYMLAFAIRYFWGMRLLATAGDNFILASDDGLAYNSIADILSRGNTLPKETALGLNGFGYWYFLTAIYKIFNPHNFKAIIIIQSLFGSTVPVFTYLIAKRVFGMRPVSIIAGLLTCFNLTLVFLSVVIGMESLYIPFLFLAFTAAAYFLSSENFDYKKGFILGGLFGFVNNIRGELLFMPFILSIAVLVTKSASKPARIISAICCIFLGFMLLASIQHIVSYRQYGEYHLTQTALKDTFGSNRFTDENKILSEVGFNPFRDRGASMDVFLRRPVFISELILKGFFKRIVVYCFQPNFGVFDPIFLVNPASGFFFRYPLFLQLYGYIFIIFGIWSSFISRKNMGAELTMLIFMCYIASIYSFLLVTNSRCRGALIPVTALFASYGIAVLCKRARDYYNGVL